MKYRIWFFSGIIISLSLFTKISYAKNSELITLENGWTRIDGLYYPNDSDHITVMNQHAIWSYSKWDKKLSRIDKTDFINSLVGTDDIESFKSINKLCNGNLKIKGLFNSHDPESIWVWLSSKPSKNWLVKVKDKKAEIIIEVPRKMIIKNTDDKVPYSFFYDLGDILILGVWTKSKVHEGFKNEDIYFANATALSSLEKSSIWTKIDEEKISKKLIDEKLNVNYITLFKSSVLLIVNGTLIKANKSLNEFIPIDTQYLVTSKIGCTNSDCWFMMNEELARFDGEMVESSSFEGLTSKALSIYPFLEGFWVTDSSGFYKVNYKGEIKKRYMFDMATLQDSEIETMVDDTSLAFIKNGLLFYISDKQDFSNVENFSNNITNFVVYEMDNFAAVYLFRGGSDESCLIYKKNLTYKERIILAPNSKDKEIIERGELIAKEICNDVFKNNEIKIEIKEVNFEGLYFENNTLLLTSKLIDSFDEDNELRAVISWAIVHSKSGHKKIIMFSEDFRETTSTVAGGATAIVGGILSILSFEDPEGAVILGYIIGETVNLSILLVEWPVSYMFYSCTDLLTFQRLKDAGYETKSMRSSLKEIAKNRLDGRSLLMDNETGVGPYVVLRYLMTPAKNLTNAKLK